MNYEINQNVLPLNHSYQKDAKAFIRAIKKREQLIKEIASTKQPLLEIYGVQSEWELEENDVHDYIYQIRINGLDTTLRKLGSKLVNLNKRLEKIKWGFWACYPAGTTEYYEIHPKGNSEKFRQ